MTVAKKVMLDTTFLIDLSKEDNEFHKFSASYLNYMESNKYSMYVSSIVYAEYCSGDPGKLEDILRYKPMAFNFDHALETGRIINSGYLKQKDPKIKRWEAKNDCKIMASSSISEIGIILTRNPKDFERFQPVLNNRIRVIDYSKENLGSLSEDGQHILL